MGYFSEHPWLQQPGKKILPVVHVFNSAQALSNTDLALKLGADGVFLIDHEKPWRELIEVYEVVRAYWPKAFIGLNFLDLDPINAHAATERTSAVSALWSDNVGITDTDISLEAIELASHMVDKAWDGLYFGGTAFKGQGWVNDEARAARLASEMCHVVTTSGRTTGSAADIEKLAAMKAAIGDRLLATASGYSIENAAEQLQHIDVALVASSVCRDFHNFDEAKLRELIEFTHAFGQ